MATKTPPLPPGFEYIEEDAPAPAKSAAPPLPEGFEYVEDDKPKLYRATKSNLEAMHPGKKAEDVQDENAVYENAYTGKMFRYVNGEQVELSQDEIDQVTWSPRDFDEYRRSTGQLTDEEVGQQLNRVFTNKSLNAKQREAKAIEFLESIGRSYYPEDIANAAKRGVGAKYVPVAEDPDEDEIARRQAEAFEEDVKAAMARRGIEADDGWFKRFVSGAGRAPERIVEGLAQLGLRGAAALEIVNEIDAMGAFDDIARDAQVRDKAEVRGRAGKVGVVAGDIAATAAFPMGRASVAGRIGVAATAAKRAASGAAIGALQPANSPQEQNVNTLMGAIAAPALVPVAEKVVGRVGHEIAQGYMKIAGQGVGKRIMDANGNLTPFGRALKVRLERVNPDIPPEWIDDTLAAIVKANPRRLPRDEAMVAEYIAKEQDVPLTGGMKENDVHRVQDFQRAQAGEFGAKTQAKANEIDQNIDTAVLDNIKGINTSGRTLKEGAEDTARLLSGEENKAKRNVDALYEKFSNTNGIIDDARPLAVVADDYASKMGRAGVYTTLPTVSNFLKAVTSLAEERTLRFGDIWKLGKEINAAARASTNAQEKYQLDQLRAAFNDFLEDAPETMFRNKSAEQLKLLKQANTANRQMKERFTARDKISGSGNKQADKAGEAIEQISRVVQNSVDNSTPINTLEVEEIIFGSGKGVSGASGTQAINKMRRTVKAAPETKEPIKAMSVHRVVRQIEEGVTTRSLKETQLPKVVKEIVDRNREVLEAAGWTRADITTLEKNAWLASLKGLQAKAANPSGSGKWFRVAIGTAFRKAIAGTTGLATLGAATGTANPMLAVMAGTVFVGAEIAKRRVAKRALSGKVATNKEAPRAAVNAGRIGAKALTSQIEAPPEDE